jgi:2-polyprenyl-6-methoxyphenol hydroxylase-like FAD-dependent oxidoreductase
VIVQGVHGDDTPTDREGFVEFVESLPVAELGRQVTSQPWVSEEIEYYPYPSSRRRRYEELERFPDGLVVTGDAIASFNPIYGQGMSVAALDAVVLHHVLASDGVEDVGRRFFDRATPLVDAVWQMAAGADFAFPQTSGPKPTGIDLTNRYVARLLRKAHTDPVLSEAFLRVMRLEQPSTTLMRPGIAWRVLRPSGSVTPLHPWGRSTSG